MDLHASLLSACESGALAQLHELLTRPGTAEHIDDRLNFDGMTALMVAAKHGRADCTRLLIERGASVNATRSDGTTALSLAALGNAAATTWLLLSANANPHATDSAGTTPLHWAAYSGALECVRCLLYARADPSCRDEDGTPADTAVARRHNDCSLVLQAAAYLHSGGTLPTIQVKIENHAAHPVRLFQCAPCNPNEEDLGMIPAASPAAVQPASGVLQPGGGTVQPGDPRNPTDVAVAAMFNAAAAQATPAGAAAVAGAVVAAMRQGTTFSGYELRLKDTSGEKVRTRLSRALTDPGGCAFPWPRWLASRPLSPSGVKPIGPCPLRVVSITTPECSRNARASTPSPPLPPQLLASRLIGMDANQSFVYGKAEPQLWEW